MKGIWELCTVFTTLPWIRDYLKKIDVELRMEEEEEKSKDMEGWEPLTLEQCKKTNMDERARNTWWECK